MRYEKAIYADGFERSERFELKEGFVPLTFDLKEADTEILRQAMQPSPILRSNFGGLALTTSVRNVEQQLIDDCGMILTGRKAGWYLLGCRAIREWQEQGLKAEFYLYHKASQLFFTLALAEKTLAHYELQARFDRIIDKIIPARV